MSRAAVSQNVKALCAAPHQSQRTTDQSNTAAAQHTAVHSAAVAHHCVTPAVAQHHCTAQCLLSAGEASAVGTSH